MSEETKEVMNMLWEKMKQQDNIIVTKSGDLESIQDIEGKAIAWKGPAKYWQNKSNGGNKNEQ